MRASSHWTHMVFASAAAALIALATPLRAETDDAIARLLAETQAKSASATKQANDIKVTPATRPQPADEQRMLDEIDMLERARAEAEVRHMPPPDAGKVEADAWAIASRRTEEAKRRAAEERHRADEQRAAEARRKADAERRRAEEDRRQAGAKRLAEEDRDRALRQKAEDERRKVEEDHRLAEQKRLAEDSRALALRQKAENERREAEEARLQAEEKRLAREQEGEAEARLAEMEAAREAEAQRIDEVLREARETHRLRQQEAADRARDDSARAHHTSLDDREGTRAGTARQPYGYTGGTAPSGYERRVDAASHEPFGDESDTRVTVLMVMAPGDRGIRRHNKTADPLLCGERGCYVGAGSDRPAQLLPRYRAFGVGRTLGARAGACRNSLGCIYRGVDLVSYPAVLQPVDMRVMRHDRREPHVIQHASRCSGHNGRLSCTPVLGPDYMLWIVPERLAERVGAAELERVIAEGLTSTGTLARRD